MNRTARPAHLASLLVLTAALAGCAIYDTVPADAPVYESYGYPDSYRGPGYYGPGYYQPGYYGGYWYGGGYYTPPYGGYYAPYPYYPGTHVIITGRGRDHDWDRDRGDGDRYRGDGGRDHRGDDDDRDRDHRGGDGQGQYRPPNAPIPGDPRGFNRRPHDPEPPPQAVRPTAPYTPPGRRDDNASDPREDRSQGPGSRYTPRAPAPGDSRIGPSRQAPPPPAYQPRTPPVAPAQPRQDERRGAPGRPDEDRNDRLRY